FIQSAFLRHADKLGRVLPHHLLDFSANETMLTLPTWLGVLHNSQARLTKPFYASIFFFFVQMSTHLPQWLLLRFDLTTHLLSRFEFRPQPATVSYCFYTY